MGQRGRAAGAAEHCCHGHARCAAPRPPLRGLERAVGTLGARSGDGGGSISSVVTHDARDVRSATSMRPMRAAFAQPSRTELAQQLAGCVQTVADGANCSALKHNTHGIIQSACWRTVTQCNMQPTELLTCRGSGGGSSHGGQSSSSSQCRAICLRGMCVRHVLLHGTSHARREERLQRQQQREVSGCCRGRDCYAHGPVHRWNKQLQRTLNVR
jgi:hypothetical protein